MRDELLRRFAGFGNRTALFDQGTGFTYEDLLNRIHHTRDRLAAHGVAPHDVVIVHGDYSVDSIATLLALFLNRNVVVPVVTLNALALDTLVEHCRPGYLVRTGTGLDIQDLQPSGDPLARRDGQQRAGTASMIGRLSTEDAAGLILLSSGSTGAPKVILHNLDALVSEKLTKRPRRSSNALNILMVLMFDHIGGINSLLSALLVGGTAILPRQRVPDEICGLIEEHRILVLPTSPTFLNLIMVGGYHRKYDLSSLRLITYGTEPMSEELLRRVNQNFPGVRLLQTFGTSETGIATTTSESSSSTYFKISDDSVEYRIVDGELQLRSRTQFLGYLNSSDDALTEDRWFRTGDLVEETPDGYIKIKGRAKEVINVGGEKLIPLELESVLLTSPLVEDCVVYGRPNAITGQSVCVDIKPKGALTRMAVRKHVLEFLSGRVEPFKIPSKVTVVDSIEMSARLKKIRSRRGNSEA
ncbi:adenylating enzyme cmlK [Micromonospora sp. ATCC 39149]|uniref:Long-chain fatty acid--CoA ligase n=1 Tax=Micromonospora carbonacea TaxID=47853 RepID=A0A7D6CG61_9ACTN|nr:AMP-binding protein [Micromonospora sp. ATCC 39149]EEP74971.1 adenylating enzyme cmlK [Micromonospora sp. ATCC 39149]QLK00718.1 long-chain fatty acid--CoA ligase [Micromonospora carbonacea]